MYSKIGFLGLGLIGGSIAKAIKVTYPESKMYAITSSDKTIHEAYEANIIENESIIPIEFYKDCDLIFLCSPVSINISYLKQLKSIVSDTCIITDVGSVKGEIDRAAIDLNLASQFIGGHPMCGSEKIGFASASEYLLENAYYVITQNDYINPELVDQFVSFISSLGALTLTMSSTEHDYITAGISHLPHVVASALVNTVKKNDTQDELMKAIAAGGFRDITRIASSSPVMWQNICQSNSEEILHLFDLFEEQMNEYKKAIKNSSDSELNQLFQSAKDYRDSLPIKSVGLLPNIYELFLDVEDEAGAIAKVATILADNNISIQNIGIVNNREFENGVIRIETADEESLAMAINFLKDNNYKVYER